MSHRIAPVIGAAERRKGGGGDGGGATWLRDVADPAYPARLAGP
jgi:hypothetical protein